MRLLPLLVGLLLPFPARAAEPPAALAAEPKASLDGADGLFSAPPRAAATPTPTGDDAIRIDLVLGLPTALRVQARLGDTKVWAEGGAAVYVVVPSVFVGLRYDGLLHRGPADALLARPGLDVYYVPVYGSDWLFGNYRHGIGVVAADFDMAWHHRWSDAVSGNVGIKLGCGVGVTESRVVPVPIVGVTLGLQF